jgi:hypothetical protein
MAKRSNSLLEDKQQLMKFAKFLFESIDIDMSESVEGKELIETLLGLGLAASYDMIAKTLSTIFQVPNIEKISLTFDDF